MRIIKHGCMTVKEFVCDRCGCEWEADQTECRWVIMTQGRNGYACRCPECGKDVEETKRKECTVEASLAVAHYLFDNNKHVKFCINGQKYIMKVEKLIEVE